MKRKLLLFLLVGLCPELQAQTRLSLYEEFTGEQCFPCTATNPGLQALLGSNTAKVAHLAYQSPYPVAGPLYTAYATISNARISYYGIATAPQGKLNGTQNGTGTASPIPGHAANLTQSDINTAYATPSPFNLTVSHTWAGNGDSVIVQISINTPTAYAPPGAAFRLRIALIEQLHYSIPPGINGERTFPNVVREMYPNAGGTILNSSWTMGQSTSFSVSGLVPKYINKESANIIAWIQNDANKSVQQVALSTISAITLDASAAAIKPIARLQCAAGAAMVPSMATLRNAGTATLTSAKIYYRTDGGAPALYSWAGSLGTGGSTIIPLPAIAVGGGNHMILDSVVGPNGGTDVNSGNNIAIGPVNIFNTVGVNLPIANGFEGAGGAIPSGWVMYDADSNGQNFVVTKNIFGGNAGFGNSTYFLLHNNYYVPAGETNFAILPKGNLPSDKLLSFALAHAPYAAENDQLDIVYSMDCGNSWTSVWNVGGSGMTASAPTTSFFIPSASDWESKAIDVSAIPYGAIIAFRAISDFGNSLYIDNVHLYSPSGISKTPDLHSTSIHPNPAKENTTLTFGLSQPDEVRVEVVDMTGRIVQNIPQSSYGSGLHGIQLSLTAMAPGTYYVRVHAAGGTIVRKMLKI